MNIVEMDTVIGTRDSKKCLMTLYIRKTHFMFIFLLEKKDSASVNAKINFLKEKLGSALYSKVFRIFLTDNGTEFYSVLNFERDLNTNTKLSNLLIVTHTLLAKNMVLRLIMNLLEEFFQKVHLLMT